MDETTVWAALLRGTVGPVLMLVLFGVAAIGGWAVWRYMPRGKTRDGLLMKLDPILAGALTAGAIAIVCVGAAIYSG